MLFRLRCGKYHVGAAFVRHQQPWHTDDREESLSRLLWTTFAALLTDTKPLDVGTLVRPTRPLVPAAAPKVLIFAPHPDDEVIIGGLAAAIASRTEDERRQRCGNLRESRRSTGRTLARA